MSGADFSRGNIVQRYDICGAKQNERKKIRPGQDAAQLPERQSRNTKKSKAEFRRDSSPELREKAGPALREKAAPDAEELRESKPGLLKDSDAPLKKNRIGPLKKKRRTKPPTDSGDGKREKHKPGFRKTAEPRTGRTELGPESRQSLSTSVRSRRHPSMRGISP